VSSAIRFINLIALLAFAPLASHTTVSGHRFALGRRAIARELVSNKDFDENKTLIFAITVSAVNIF
jgi:hypothetical protein